MKKNITNAKRYKSILFFFNFYFSYFIFNTDTYIIQCLPQETSESENTIVVLLHDNAHPHIADV